MKKLTFVLCLALLLPLFVFQAAAYGSSESTLIVTHINVDPAYYEGSGAIYTTSSDGTLGAYSPFTWWYTVSFEWNEQEGCYLVSEVRNTVNSSKSAVVIPENGFVYCVNLGNDYPQLVKDDPNAYGMYADETAYPDYTTDAVTASFEYAAKLKVGDKAYLYGADLNANIILANEVLWYKEGYKSDTQISIGAPISGKEAYNPAGGTDIKAEFRFGINAINAAANEGQSVLYTRKWGTDIMKNGTYSYDWWKVAVFDLNDAGDAYVLTELDLAAGSNRPKCTIIPENGFVLAVNLGNNYTSSGGINYVNNTASYVFEKLSMIKPGTEVYLTGIDIAKGTFEYTGNINAYYGADFKTNGFINAVNEKPANAYVPEASGERLAKPEFTTENDLFVKGDVKLEWKPTANAEKYLIYLCDTTASVNGSKVYSGETSEASYTISADKIGIGSTYTLRVCAIANGYRTSEISAFSFRIASERALNSRFRDKKVVAFGDSITEATGGWVYQMFGELGTDVINAGVGGDTTVHALVRIDSEVISLKPDIVIVNFGMNDQAYQTASKTNLVPLDQYEANYRIIIEKLQASGAQVVLVAVHDVYKQYFGSGGTLDYATGAITNYDSIVKKLATEYNTGFLDINALAKDDLANITTAVDGIHLSAHGNRKYCEWICDYLYSYIKDGDDTQSGESAAPSESSAAEVSNASGADDNGGLSTLEIGIIAAVMFIGISVVGVLFIKSVNKNKKKH